MSPENSDEVNNNKEKHLQPSFMIRHKFWCSGSSPPPSPVHQLQRGGGGGRAGTGLFNAALPGGLSSLRSLHHHHRGFIVSNGLLKRLLFSPAFPPAPTPLVPVFHLIYGGKEKKSIGKNKHLGAVAAASESIWISCVFLLRFSRGLMALTSHPSIPAAPLFRLIGSPAVDGGIRKSSFGSIPC